MPYQDVPAKPTMLVLSHCVPDPIGSPQRARAWQLINHARLTHRLSVACVADAPVNMQHWTVLNKRTENLYIEKTRRLPRWTGAVRQYIDEPMTRRRTCASALGPALDGWLEDQHFDALLCTHPALWPLAARVPAALTICDFNRPVSALHRHHRKHSPRPVARWHRRQARLWHEVEGDILRRGSIITLAHLQDLHRLPAARAQAIALPDAVDLDWYQPAPMTDQPLDISGRDAQAAGPMLTLLHIDRSAKSARRTAAWFRRNVWPAVKRAVPTARFDDTVSHARQDVRQSLLGADVVAAPVSDAHPSTLPMLQAMAMARPVVASSSVTLELDVKHGQHLLLARRSKDWADYCIQALRSAQIAAHLGHQARRFVEQYATIAYTGAQLRAALQTDIPAPHRRAA